MIRKMTVRDLKRRGFDISRRNGQYLVPRCSQCEVLVINGVACHEQNCHNRPRPQRRYGS